MSDNMLYSHVQGCFWALMAGFVTGVTRVILVFVFPAPESCGQPDNRPDVIRKLHYMYFAILLFWVTVISGIIVTYLTPPPTPQQVWLFDCLGLTSLLNTRGHFTTTPTCCSGTLTKQECHAAWHPTPSQYTDTGPTCRCAIHWCGTLHWYTQLTIFMSWVRPDREIVHRPSTHAPANVRLYDAGMVVISQKLGRKCTVHAESWIATEWFDHFVMMSFLLILHMTLYQRRNLVDIKSLRFFKRTSNAQWVHWWSKGRATKPMAYFRGYFICLNPKRMHLQTNIS